LLCDDLTYRALRTVGKVAQGDPLDGNDSATGFQIANDMLDGWAAQRLTIYQTLAQNFPLVAGQGSPSTPYTIGPGGTFNVPRPVWIPNATIRLLSSVPVLEYGLRIYESENEWAHEAIKALASALPTGLYYDGAFPTTGAGAGLGNIFLYPVPNGQQPIGLTLYLPTPLTAFADQNVTQYTFPPGYAEALRYQLAKRLASEFGIPLTAEAAALAVETFGIIKRPNGRIPLLRSGLPRFAGSGGSGGLWNWRLGRNG
jgi:hypothetical protein